MEFRSIVLESTRSDRRPDLPHQPLVEVQVMHGVQMRTQYLTALIQVAQITAAVMSAGVALAPRLDGAGVLLMLRIADDGRGFDVAAANSNGSHFGLTGMKERTAMIAGRIEIESLTGLGTSVTMDVDI